MVVVRSAVRSGVLLATAVLVCQVCVFQPRATAASRLAQAQDAAMARVTQMNREALAAIDAREFEKARELLKKALDTCQGAGLDRHPLAARTHVHMGVVIIEGFKNRELGVKQFAAALAIEPSINLTPSLATPELTEAFDQAKSDGASMSASTSAPASAASGSATIEPVTPLPSGHGDDAGDRAGGGFTYHTVSEVKQGNPIKITVNVDESLRFKRIVLAYRAQGGGDFLGREMDPVGGGAYSAEIPERATGGASVAYYIEAQDDDGQPVANRGSEARPLVIQLDESHDSGHASAAARSRSKAPDDNGDSTTVSAEAETDDQAGAGAASWFVSLMVGSGVGTTSGNGELNANVPAGGEFASTSLGHLEPEVGYWLGADFLLSLQGRIQRLTGPTEIAAANGHVYAPTDWALAVFAKASLFFGDGDFRPFVAGGLGGGQIRHVVTLAAYKDCGASRNQTCVDSVVAGPALAEAGGGLVYKLTPSFGLAASSNLEVAAPKFTFNIDLNAGVALTF